MTERRGRVRLASALVAISVALGGCTGAGIVEGPGGSTVAPSTSQVPTASSSQASSPEASQSALPAKVQLDRGSSLSLNPVPYNGRRLVTASFTEAVPGRGVALQRETPAGWETIALREQDGGGTVDFLVADDDHHAQLRFRAVAGAHLSGDSSLEPVSTPTARLSDQWRRTFGDGFDGSRINGKKWSVRQEGKYFGSRLCSAPWGTMTSTRDGQLRARVDAASAKRAAAVREEAAAATGEKVSKACPHGVFDNAMIATHDKYEFKHGVVAARMKFPKPDGVHASLWLQSDQRGGHEIDIIETFGFGRPVQHKVWYRDKAGKLKSVGGTVKNIPEMKSESWWDEHHVVSLEWSKDEYLFRIDGVETFRTSHVISTAEQYVILSLLSSDWELGRIDAANLPATFLVDWVQVWQAA